MNAPQADLQSRLANALRGQYQIERVLGVGGMGTVFLATDTTLDRPVAVKVIAPDVASSAELRQRFLLEARTVARLRHPNIVSVYAAGESDGLLWFAMEYVPGESLRDRLQREQSLPSDVVINIVHDLAMALDDAHAAGVVHRDVKPENILLDRETGRAMLTDFGVARALSSGDSRLTGAGFVLGSPRYMSPEQASGEDDIDGRSDLYSLGLVAYEMIAGRPVVTAETPASILAKHLTEEPIPLRTLSTDVPDALDTVIREALRKQPDARYARGRMMALVLEGRDPNDVELSGNRTLNASRLNSAPRRSASVFSRGRVASAVVAGLAVFGAFQFFTSDRASSTPQNERTWLIAPFELQSGNSSLDWLRDGAVNMLGLTLSQWNDLSVVDYERTLDLLNDVRADETRRVSLDDARRIARRAAAGTVVMGQITSANDSLFLVARLFDVATGSRIDTATAGIPIDSDPRVAFDRIARGLLDLMNGPALSVELTRQTTESVAAYRLYLDGLRALNRWRTDEADAHFAEAIAIDSTFALAYYKRSLGLGWRNIDDSLYLQSAENAVRFGARLSPRQREVLTANRDLARGFQAASVADTEGAVRNWRSARERLTTLVATDSGDGDVWYGLADADYHMALNGALNNPDSTVTMLNRSMRAFERAIELDSTFHLAYQHLVEIYQMSATSSSGVLIDSDRMLLASSVADTARRSSLRRAAQDRAKQFASSWLELEPDGPQAWQALLNTYAVLTQFDSAILLLERARERPAVFSPAMAYSLPLYRAMSGDPDQAVSDLRDAITQSDPDSLGVRTTTPGTLLPFIGMTTAAATGSITLLDSLGAVAEEASPVIPIFGLPTRATANWYAAGARLAMGAPATPQLQRVIRSGIEQLNGAGEGGTPSSLRQQSIGVPYVAYLATRDSSFVGVVRDWLPPAVRLLELDASLALDRGDTLAARRLAAEFPTADQLRNRTLTSGGVRALTQAEVRARLGDLRGALDTYAAMELNNLQLGMAEPGAALFVRSYLVRARLYEQLGEADKATAAYERFVSWWSNADPSLHDELREARMALQRLRDGARVQTVPGTESTR